MQLWQFQQRVLVIVSTDAKLSQLYEITSIDNNLYQTDHMQVNNANSPVISKNGPKIKAFVDTMFYMMLQQHDYCTLSKT